MTGRERPIAVDPHGRKVANNGHSNGKKQAVHGYRKARQLSI